MGKRGPKPRAKIIINWSANFAYAIGLLVADGNLSLNLRHINFVSKDIEQIINFQKCLKINMRIGKTISGYDGNFCYRVQFGDVLFFKFLNSIGILPCKSKTISEIKIPTNYFYDYLRGYFDGDGSFYSYWDKRWKSSHMFYIEFVSGSKIHIEWLRKKLNSDLRIFGHISNDKSKNVFQLRYAKKESMEILKKMYYNNTVVCLSRKRQKIKKALILEKKQQKQYLSRG